MLEGLFDEASSGVSTCLSKGPSRGDAPLSPRKANGLCGIYNQGATCFLNSLIQTLLMTPEFRESLFELEETELGCIADKDKADCRVRIIPIQLQKLFARLLLLNVEGVSTEELTNSFGWNSQDCIVQHDVQELNRILFSAIEDSLVGTSGEHLIKNLYHGTIVNQIVCNECHRVSEREEDFLDLCMTLSGNESLEQSLMAAFSCMELLDGANKYRCEGCKRLVTAEKGAKIRRLPPVLTVSLLRFSFDYKKLERYKETGKFSFPRDLDMTMCCENQRSDETAQYELFSVVIHRGSTHGGHYHCYIRDVDGLGNWSKPDEQEIQLPVDPATGKVDYIEFDSPIELLQALLAKSPEKAMPVDKLCAELTKQTGVSWNKRFKSKHGAISKFLKKYCDKFDLDPTTNWVSLRRFGAREDCDVVTSRYNDTSGTVAAVMTSLAEEENARNDGDRNEGNKTRNNRPKSPPPEPGYTWFDYDDSRIAPIRSSEIEKQFSGKESAYMLFYRHKSMHRPPDAYGDQFYRIPPALVEEVMQENDRLQAERTEYETRVNTVTLTIHLAQFYSHEGGALQPDAPPSGSLELSIDWRKTIADLKLAIKEVGGELVTEDFVIHTAKQLPAGLHLYDCVSGDLDKVIRHCGISHQDNLFVWDGKEVSGEAVLTGSDHEPIYLNITTCDNVKVCRGFPTSLQASTLVAIVTDQAAGDTARAKLCRVIRKGESTECIALSDSEMQKTLGQLKVYNGDSLICQTGHESPGPVKPTAFKHVKLCNFIVELRSQPTKEDGSYPVTSVQVESDVSVAELKRNVTSQARITSLGEGGRLRIDHANLGLRPPLHEQQSLEMAGLKSDARLVLENGPAPKSNEIALSFTSHAKAGSNIEYMDIMVDKKLTVDQCLQSMLRAAAMQDDNWHLRKTNVFQEATEVLDGLEMTLDECNLHDGDLILLEEGRLPQKGFLKLDVFLLPSPQAPEKDIVSYITDGVKALFSRLQNGDQKPEPVLVGEVVISKEASLVELKLQIMTLPSVSDLTVPSAHFLRLRVLEDGHPAAVLKGDSIPLKRLKLATSSQIGVQALTHEETLNSNHLILEIVERITKSRTYKPGRELVWNTKDGATPQALRQAVADLLVLLVDQVAVYKHTKQHDWMLISDSAQRNKQNKGKRKGQKTNIKNTPYCVKDGDLIGVKNLQLDPYNQDDMATAEDATAKARAHEEAQLKKTQREENRMKNDAMDLGLGTGKQKKREEVAIKIHVENFR